MKVDVINQMVSSQCVAQTVKSSAWLTIVCLYVRAVSDYVCLQMTNKLRGFLSITKSFFFKHENLKSFYFGMENVFWYIFQNTLF